VAAQSLEEADRRLAQELAYGVLRLRGRLDHIIGTLVEGGVGSLDVEVLDALRLGAYQLLELDRVPAYAAVSEAVEAAKRAAGKGAASLTNAVLRRLSHSAYNSFTFPALEEDPLAYLSTWGSHPRWLLG
jgi:16S rRNA (cytosine967-C5)-methyltransferase